MTQRIEDWESGDNLLLLEGWARDGITDEQIASNMGINRSTLYRWQKRSDIIRNTLKRTKEVVDREVENALYKAAIEGNTTAMIFWLKNRNPKAWRDKVEQEVTHNLGENIGVIEIPQAMEQPDEE